jgi:hypothetical protein
MVKGDLRPSILATLQYSDGSAVDLTGSTVNFQMFQNGVQLINKPCTIVSPSSGVVRYDWIQGDTDHLGTCPAQFEVTFPDGTNQTFPVSQDFAVEFTSPAIVAAPSAGYVAVGDVEAHLNMTYDSLTGNYTVYGLMLSEAALQAHVDYANTYITALNGGLLDPTDQRYAHAKIAALDLACLRALVISSGGSLVGAYDYFLGDLRVARTAPYAAALARTIQGLSDDLQKQLVNLTLPVIAAEASMKDDVPTYQGGLMNP